MVMASAISPLTGLLNRLAFYARTSRSWLHDDALPGLSQTNFPSTFDSGIQ
jgi:GGDEF domain-containing protein